MRSVALPLPMEPKMKFESRDVDDRVGAWILHADGEWAIHRGHGREGRSGGAGDAGWRRRDDGRTRARGEKCEHQQGTGGTKRGHDLQGNALLLTATATPSTAYYVPRTGIGIPAPGIRGELSADSTPERALRYA